MVGRSSVITWYGYQKFGLDDKFRLCVLMGVCVRWMCVSVHVYLLVCVYICVILAYETIATSQHIFI